MPTLPRPAYVGFLTPEQFGARADGVTDDRAAFIRLVSAIRTANSHILLGGPSKSYKLSKYVDFLGFRGLRVIGEGAEVFYASADTGVGTDAVATTTTMARSAFLLRYCQGVTVGPGIVFRGSQDRDFTTKNLGSGVFAHRCRDIVLDTPKQLWGYSTIQQNQEAPTAGTGDSVTYSSGTLTLVDAAGSFISAHAGMLITLAGFTNQGNNGVWRISGYTSATTITIDCPSGATETSAFTWRISDDDDDLVIRNGNQYGCRGVNRLPRRHYVLGGEYRWPVQTMDTVGVGDALSITGTTVTLTDYRGPFKPFHHGKYIRIDQSTTAANDGYYGPITYISATQVSFTNAAGVTERFPGRWWVISGSMVGVGAGVGAIAISAGTTTLTVAGTPFDGSQVGMTIRLANPTTAGNGRWAIVTAVPANNQLQYLAQSGSAAENFSGVWSLDDWDSNSTAGSTHGFYQHAANDLYSSGRSESRFIGVTFEGNRTTCMKFSGTSSPMRDVIVSGCSAVNCSGLVVFGADDSQEHSMVSIVGNQMIDCGNYTHRLGPGNFPIDILGARNVLIDNNQIHHTRDTVQIAGTGTFTSHYAISVARYIGGTSQPIEDATITNNKITRDLANSLDSAFEYGIYCAAVGQRAKWRTGGTLTKVGNVMTLLDTSAKFYAGDDVGKSITLVNAPNAGNNGTFVVETVPGSTSLTFTNAAGVGGSVGAGTWRLPPNPINRLSACHITGNQILQTAGTGIRVEKVVAPLLTHNTFAYCSDNISLSACAFPFIDANVSMGNRVQRPPLKIESTCSWPIVGVNTTSGVQQIRNSVNRPKGWDVAIDGTATEDHPLLGTHGRCLTTDGREEIVIAFGSQHVDGDTIAIVFGGTNTFTYKASAPGANQFTTCAQLITLINGIANLGATDYGAGFTPAVVTNHIRIRRTVASVTNSNVTLTTSTLNPTALVALYNQTGTTSNARADSQGCATAGPINDKAVVWTPNATLHGACQLIPANAAAQVTMQANGPAFKAVDQYNSGACEVMNTGVTVGTEEFRWMYT